MAKGIDLFLVLLSAAVFFHQRDESVSVVAAEVAELEVLATTDEVPMEVTTGGVAVDPSASEEAFARDRLQQIYSAEVGVRERTGRNDGKRVAEYLGYTDLGEGYAWCASFVSWVYGKAGYSEPRTAWSPSLFPSKRVIWSRGDNRRPSEPQSVGRDARFLLAAKESPSFPQKGDVFGIYFNSVKRIAHAGFVDEWGEKYVITVEGNTNEGGGREGDGVYRKRRPVSSIYRVAAWL